VKAAYDILQAAGCRYTKPEIISCPTCGRLQYDLVSVVKEIESRVKNIKVPIKIAVLGCVVNGPGEAAGADIGLAGGVKTGILFSKGKELRRVKQENMVAELMREIDKLVKRKKTC
jgi:(E)-4-hydroxy-3-methylbut-2-enyl-diphosphate synthase